MAGLVVVVFAHGMLRRWTATAAAFMSAEPAGGADLHPERSAGPKRERRMAEAEDFASRCKGRLCLSAENPLPPPLPIRPACRPIALRKAVARSSDATMRSPARDAGPRTAIHSLAYPGATKNRVKSCGMSWTRRCPRSASAPKARRSSFRSPSTGHSVTVSIPAAVALPVSVSLARSPAGSLSRTM